MRFHPRWRAAAGMAAAVAAMAAAVFVVAGLITAGMATGAVVSIAAEVSAMAEDGAAAGIIMGRTGLAAMAGLTRMACLMAMRRLM